MADRRQMENGWSWQNITTSHSLLKGDFTNPLNWYNSTAQNNILNLVHRAEDNNNNNTFFSKEKLSKVTTATKLPRINTQGGISGSKSAGNKTSIKSTENYKVFLTRGPSFDEVTSKLHQATVCSLYEAVFPPPLGKSISWPRGSRVEAKRRVNRSSKISTGSNQEESRIYLPPFILDSGQPFLPHIPPHQPWVSSGENRIKNKVNSEFHMRQHGHKQLRLLTETGKDQSDRNKTEKWFQEITASDVTNGRDPYLVDEQLHRNTPCPPVDGLPRHPPITHSRQGHYGSKPPKDVSDILVPDLKDPVQFSPVFKELRISRKENPDQKTQINRDEYKMKQKSSLGLKMVDIVKCESEDKGDLKLTRVQLALSMRNGAGVTQTRLKKEADIQRKPKLHVSKLKERNKTKADRHTGMKFLLARASDDSDLDDEISLDETSEVNNNNNNAEMTNVTVSTEAGPLETKASVLNIVLPKERPPDRNPRHIALSLKKMEEQKQQSSDRVVPNCSQVSGNSLEAKTKPLEPATVSNGRTNPDEITPPNQSVEHCGSNLNQEKFSSQVISEVPKTGHDVCKEKYGNLETKTVDSYGHGRCTKETKDGTPREKENEENSNVPIPKENFSTVQGTSTFTFTCKTDMFALSKYNIVQPFRDQTQPNIVLPSGGHRVTKPACNEWTHPPAYKLDLRNYEDAAVKGFRVEKGGTL